MTPKDYLEKFTKLHKKEIDLGLTRVEALLNHLGRPHLKLPPVVHVAGTNGKGSTLAFLKFILEAAGYKVHRYTSPHLVHFNERIELAGHIISDADLIDACRFVDETIEKNGIKATFFEATTAAAFVSFAKHKADVVLLETGMGGRLDATNVIPEPILTLITPIHFDHEKFLGNTLPEIAREKAGIFKKGTLALSAPQAPEVKETLEAQAQKIGAPLLFVPGDVLASVRKFSLGLMGPHQYTNAALAVMAADALRQKSFKIKQKDVAEGLAATTWRGRFHKIAPHIWVDAAHNSSGAQVLADTLRTLPSEPTTLIWGMKEDKDVQTALKAFSGVIDNLWAVQIPSTPCHSPEAIVTVGENLGIPSKAMEFEDALAQARATKNHRFVIAGSIYLIGAVLAKIGL